jgi:outer membrane protein insertion porin family
LLLAFLFLPFDFLLFLSFFLPMFGLLGFDYGLGIDKIQTGQPMKNAFKFTFMLGQEPE